MSKRRLNPMRMPPSLRDSFAKTLIATLFAANVAGFTMLGVMSMSENDPRKKNGPILKRHVESGDATGMFNIDWEQSKLEWIDIVAGIKLKGVQIFKPKPDAPKLEDYLRKKEDRLKAENMKQAERNDAK
mmetsp:Transcript_28940/g.47807  ORF Transcript_28940/g.47807 Transcript_28940/m.47807 type:complete len:130 (+) Transcript_28940:94-483(+)|eukprot:CAMPEP_0119016124 /NCGR_PEP_ID=MMETSP1176-20130426/11828_1 /TAXON_ID=265551 /ORGANISM="Synedropsis recta cf, Strain CCMP1620" /LENGTH=129 /DNA_ID=CAMNT_0006969453 /DNA_START=89 /DNA_END=478 /DNA_ORIENTATION=-